MINWKVRIKNKHFWISLVPAIIVLIQAIASIFGAYLELGEIGDKIIAVINSLFVVLTIIGVVNDPTTEGITDSAMALTYEVPKDDVGDMPIEELTGEVLDELSNGRGDENE